MTIVFMLLAAAIVLGIVGWLAEGLLWLFIIGLVLLMADLVLWGLLMGRRRGRRGRR